MNIRLASKLLFAGCIAAALFTSTSCSEPAETTSSDSTTVARDSMQPMTSNDTAMVQHAEAVISGTVADTTVSGTAKFTADAQTGRVTMVLDLEIPTKAGQTVAVHFHEHGDCGNKAEMAHGHWNPGGTNHGKWGSANFHAGDIGNIQLNAQGKGSFTVDTDLWTLGGSANKNIIGKSVIVHAGVDDYTTQPSGNSGSRIGCGVIR